MCNIENIWKRFKQEQHTSDEYDNFIQDNVDKLDVVPIIHADILYNKAMRLLQECSDSNGYATVLNILKSYLRLYISHQECTQLPLYAFSFRTCTEYAFEDLKNGTCSLVHPSFFNDPIDPLLINWLNLKILQNSNEYLYPLLLKATNYIRMRCFVTVKDNDVKNLNSLMWAHYADSHKGFCVKYRIDSSVFKNTDYCSLSMHNIKYRLPRSVGSITLNDALFAKQNIWNYEKEIRLVAYDLELSQLDEVKLIKGMHIDSIYLGCKCSEENIKRMVNLFCNSFVPIYKMVIDINNPMKYQYIRIA